MTDSNRVPATPLPLRLERLGLASVFFMHGAIFASWAGRIPQLQERLNLTDGQLGLSMFGLAFGALLSMPASGGLGARFTTAKTTTAFSLAFCLMLLFLPIAPTWLLFSISLFLFGFFQGGMDVSMNAHAVQVETAYARPIMSSFHGMFSLGAMAGGGFSAIMCGLHVAPWPHYLLVAAVFIVAFLLVAKVLAPPPVAELLAPREPALRLPDRHIMVLAMVAFCSFIGEGSMSDWSAIYLNHELGASATVGAAGFTVFCLSMAIFRFAGDRIVGWVGPQKVLMIGGILAGTAIAISLFLQNPFAVLAVYLLAGAGFSCMVPCAFSAAGKVPDVAPSVAIAGVATLGYFGYIIAPPIIGTVADHITLRGALWIPVVLSFAVSLLAMGVRPSGERPRA